MKTKLILLFLGAGLILASCTKYPPSSDRLLEDLVVMTQYDTKADFNSYKTYALADVVKKITDKDTVNLDSQTAAAILGQIDKNMKARGFVKAVSPVKPDLGIQVVYYENTYVYAYYYDYWGYYYGWYYPYYPVYYTSYTAGMGNIEMFDLKNIDPSSPRIAIRWNAFIRGLATGSHTTSEITAKIDQAFIQTPQIVTTAK
jgi:hypothetical protein